MTRSKKWSEDKLRKAVTISTSIRQVLNHLGLVEAGGNYSQIKKYITFYQLNTDHFLGQAANKGKKIFQPKRKSLQELLTINSDAQSFKLKKRLFLEGIKKPKCELCGWDKKANDGRIPVELDHINGVHTDNRLINLRILCPNCHSLQPTHRGKNIKRK